MLLSVPAQASAPLVAILLLLVVFAAAAYIFLRLFNLYRARVSQKLPIDEELAAADPDREALDRLEKSQSNLSKVHQIDFYLYFRSEASAKDAARQLEAQGFEVKVRRTGRKAEWLCFANQSMVPDYRQLVDMRQKFETLARSLAGEYDGWGTRIVK